MTAFPSPPPLDRLAIVEKIRSLFERSPVFCGARISDPQTSSEGKVSVDVGFGCGPALFRIVAPSAEKAYALLYEFARAVVENNASRPRRDSA
jgi:hypothetical protein